jgi:hypothetical protein
MPFGIDHPLDLAQCGEAHLEGCLPIPTKSPGLVGGGQPFQEQAAEEA